MKPARRLKLLVTLGHPKDQVPHLQAQRRAYLGLLDWDTQRLDREITFESDPKHMSARFPRLGAGSFYGERFYTCSPTEVVVYDVANWEVTEVFSRSSFNDLHHVHVNAEHIVVVNTGLERIEFLDHAGKLVGAQSVLNEDTWERFNRDIDYRLIDSTQPHEVHCNYLTENNGEYWVTSLKAGVFRLGSHHDRLKFDMGDPHDGKIVGEHVYYTTTNGKVVVRSRSNMKVHRVIDVQQLMGREFPIGWCRGVEVVGDRLFVGFTRIRRSRWRSFGHWIKHQDKTLSSRIVEVDLKKNCYVGAFEFGRDPGCTIFSIHALGASEATA